MAGMVGGDTRLALWGGGSLGVELILWFGLATHPGDMNVRCCDTLNVACLQ